MTATAILLVAFSATANTVTPVTWQENYSKACTRAAELHRPLAVFIGDGKADAVRDGINETNAKLLEKSYVVLYVDRSTDAGRKLAESFELKQGLVISSRDGTKQALNVSGAISADDLAKSLERFAKPDVVVTTTSTSPNAVEIAPIRPYCPSGNCPFARQ